MLIRLLSGLILLLISFISFVTFPNNGDISTFVYLTAFFIPFLYYLKKNTETITFFIYFYLSLNLYNLAPVLNYLTSGNPILLFYTPISIYSEYLYLSSIINSLILIFFKSQNLSIEKKSGIQINKSGQLFLITSGIILLYFSFIQQEHSKLHLLVGIKEKF
jgi:hypothetical protein